MKLKLREWISACAKCKSLRPPIRIFCEDCWDLLYELSNDLGELRQPHYPFEVYSLFTWYDERDHFIRPLIYALKGGVIREPWNDFAAQFLFLRDQFDFDDRSLFVIGPRKNPQDHAFWWATALANACDSKIFDCLSFDGSQKPQKSLSVKLRHERKYLLKDSFSTVEFLDRRIVFVDDTITSGGTAQAVYEALNCPPHFEVWTLVSKPRYGTC